jgi:Fe2+ transport system protein FeoA
MYSSLLNAPTHTELVLLEITHAGLEVWLRRLGLYVGSRLVRHDEEVNYYPVRIRGNRGDVATPAGLGVRIFVHLESGERKPLVEMKKNERGHVETMSCGRGCRQGLAHLGIVEDAEVTFVRLLPHMDYTVVIDRRERTRLTEGEAARLWGRDGNGEERQFYFAARNTPFEVTEIIGGRKVREHLKTHGIQPGCSLILETIEQTRELHKPGVEPIAVSSQGGLRLYLSPTQAGQMIVQSAVRQGDQPPAEQRARQG